MVVCWTTALIVKPPGRYLALLKNKKKCPTKKKKKKKIGRPNRSVLQKYNDLMVMGVKNPLLCAFIISDNLLLLN